MVVVRVVPAAAAAVGVRDVEVRGIASGVPPRPVVVVVGVAEVVGPPVAGQRVVLAVADGRAVRPLQAPLVA